MIVLGQSKNAPLGTQTIAKVTFNNLTEIDDYVFFKLSRLIGDNKPQHIGIANNWIPLQRKKNFNTYSSFLKTFLFLL